MKTMENQEEILNRVKRLERALVEVMDYVTNSMQDEFCGSDSVEEIVKDLINDGTLIPSRVYERVMRGRPW